jgi:ABC-2 type transport system ATP-binding protein
MLFVTPLSTPQVQARPNRVAQQLSVSMEQVSKSFGQVGVHDLDLEVTSGTIMGLVGPSGCGKSTTVRLLTGVYKPDGGRIRVLGEVPGHFRTRTRTQIGYMPQQYVLSQHMTVWDTLSFVASLYGMSWIGRSKRLKEVLEFVELEKAQRTRVGNLSGGMQRRLALACTLAHRPTLIFADEPTAGIDPVLRHKFWEHFRALRDEGRTLFVTTQYIGEVAMCDKVAVMRKGRLLYVDTPESLRRAAFGGDVLALQVEPRHVHQAMALVEREPLVRGVRQSRSRPGYFYAMVESGAAALPRVVAALNDQPDITLRKVQEETPSFDEVFVQLMRQQSDEDPDEELEVSNA